MKKIYILITVLALVGLFFIGKYFYQKSYEEKLGFMAKENASVFVRPHSVVIGDKDAQTYIIEFFDPACETCRDFAPFIKNIMNKNPGKIKLVLRYAPFHDGSYDVVRILEASRYQNKYFETLDVIFKYQHLWTKNHVANSELVLRFLSEAGVNVEQIKRDMNKKEIEDIINQDIADAKALNATKTPQFFVNGKPLKTFGYKTLEDLIKSELK